MMVAALLSNLIIVGCEVYTFINIKKKTDILKYYTYLQNLIALIVSLIFSVSLFLGLIFKSEAPEFVRGLRYIATSGLVATTFIYVVFLRKGNNLITKDDFSTDFNPKTANFLLHYFCPLLSLFSFIVLERQITLTNGIWTSLVAIPSCGYWLIYLFLSLTKLWEEPYDFKSSKGGAVSEILSMIVIPISFVVISFIIWNLK